MTPQPAQGGAICAAGSCAYCGCTFRKPSDMMHHRCAAMQEDQLPGPVPVDGMEDKFVWPTWREAIADAKVGVETAYERRRRVFQAAYDAGLSFRQIAKAAGLTAPSIHKIIGKQRSKPDELLDAPAFQANGAAPDQKRQP